MANIYEFDGVIPVIDSTAFVHPEAVIIGDVVIGPGCYIAPFASLRGDFGRIILQEGVNIQDSCTFSTYEANRKKEAGSIVGGRCSDSSGNEKIGS